MAQMLDFWKRVKNLLTEDNNQEWLSRTTDISTGTLSGWISKDRLPRTEKAVSIAQALDVSVEFLLTGKTPYLDDSEDVHRTTLITPNGKEIKIDGREIAMVPVLPQRISAGNGTEWMNDQEPVGSIPVVKQMLRGYPQKK